jgi:hypothetical protein
MTELMFALRRSPRTLLARDGHPGPGPGRLGLVMARAGVGKTAFLVGIGLDAMLSGQKLLHVSVHCTVGKVRKWYDDVLMEMLRREKKLEHWAAIQLEVERRRHIHTYLNRTFSPERLRQALGLLVETMEFRPQVLIVDHPGLEGVERAALEALRAIAADIGAELWMSCRIHREGPQAAPGHLPPPADRFEDLVDLAFRLDHHEAKVRLRVLTDRQQVVDRDLNILLDPETLVLVTGVSARS